MDVMTILVNVTGMKILHMVLVQDIVKQVAIIMKDVTGIVVGGILGHVHAMEHRNSLILNA